MNKRVERKETIAPSEDRSRLSMSKEERRRKLDQILEHAGTIEFDLDPETLEPAGSAGILPATNSKAK